MIPQAQGASSGVHRSYVSSATQSVTIAVDGGAATAFNTTANSTNCVVTGPLSPLQCSFSISVYQGTHSFAIAEYDQTQTGTAPPFRGNLLASGAVSNITVGPSPAPVTITPQGVPSTLAITASPASGQVSGDAASGFSATAGSTMDPASFYLDVVAQDAAGAYIIGPGQPTFAVTATGTGPVNVTQSAVISTRFTVSNTSFGSAVLHVTATGGGSTVSTTVNATSTAYTTAFSGVAGGGGAAPVPGTPAQTKFPQVPSVSIAGDGSSKFGFNYNGAVKFNHDGSSVAFPVNGGSADVADIGADAAGNAFEIGYDGSATCNVYAMPSNSQATSFPCQFSTGVYATAATSGTTVYAFDTNACDIYQFDVTALTGGPLYQPQACGSGIEPAASRPIYVAANKYAGNANPELIYVSHLSCNVHAFDLVALTDVVIAAGGGCAGNATDGDKNTGSLAMSEPPTLGLDADGNIYVLDWTGACSNGLGCNAVVRFIDTAGNLKTLGQFSAGATTGFAAGGAIGTLPYYAEGYGRAVYDPSARTFYYGSANFQVQEVVI